MLFRNVRIKFGIRHANLGSKWKGAAEEKVDSRSFGLLLACGSRERGREEAFPAGRLVLHRKLAKAFLLSFVVVQCNPREKVGRSNNGRMHFAGQI
jgi:hypothetical protein